MDKLTEQRLDEMAVHCDDSDQNGMYIVVGGTPFWEKRKKGKGSQKEHTPPHAHIRWKSKGKYMCSRFQIVDIDPPKSIEDLKTVNETDIPLDSIGETLIKWANEEPKRYKENTNWEAMRGSWIQIQSYVNEGQKHPVVLQSRDEYENLELYETMSKMFNELKENEEESSNNEFEKLVELFKNISDTLQCMMIPFTLKTKNENIIRETTTDYKNYTKQFEQLERFLVSFDVTLKQKTIDEKDESFSSHIDESIGEVVEFYENTMIDEKKSEQADRVKKSYFAFLMLSRTLNNAIINYNKEFPNHKITELKNIPEPEKIPASLDLLNSEMEKDPELKKLLTMPAKEMANNEEYKNYIYLIGEVLPQENEDNTLLDVIEGSIRYLKNDHCFFSKDSKNTLRGFLAYANGDDNSVKQVKMFSFNPKGDITFAKDLENFIKELCENHTFVSWSAVNANPANKGYVIALKKLKEQDYKIFIKSSKKRTSYFVSKNYSEEELKEISTDF